MLATDTSEKGLETLIVESHVNEAGYVRGAFQAVFFRHLVSSPLMRRPMFS